MLNPIGIVGLGLMGTAIAGRLLEHDYRVIVWNRTREKADSLLRRGAVWSENPFRECECILLSLYSSDVVREVLQVMQDGMWAGQIVIDTTTGEPDDAVAFAQELAMKGIAYLDAPISGSSVQTRNGEATVMVGGDRIIFEKLASLWRVLGKSVFHVGESGAASRMKLITNLVLGLNRAALAEGLVFAKKIGISPEQALEVLRDSAAYSLVMDTKGNKMIAQDFRPQARLSQHLKDVRIILQEAKRAGMDLSLSETHRNLLQRVELAGGGDLDNCAVIKAYEGECHE